MIVLLPSSAKMVNHFSFIFLPFSWVIIIHWNSGAMVKGSNRLPKILWLRANANSLSSSDDNKEDGYLTSFLSHTAMFVTQWKVNRFTPIVFNTRFNQRAPHTTPPRGRGGSRRGIRGFIPLNFLEVKINGKWLE